MTALSGMFFSRPGLWVAFFGPDGAGKSAVIERVKLALSPSFSAIRQFHLRAGFGRARGFSPPVTSPHANPPRGLAISLLKLLYLAADYWLGYFFFVRPALAAGGLVLFDRYYYDMLVDPRRYRLPPSVLRVAEMISWIIPQPDTLIVVDVPAEVLQRRKPEVTLEESQRQRAEYLRRFEPCPNALVVNGNQPLPQVAAEVIECIRASFASRALRPQGA